MPQLSCHPLGGQTNIEDNLTMAINKSFISVLMIFSSFMLTQSNPLLAQNDPAKNAIYFEGLGVGGFYSINYERLINTNTSLSIGYSSWTITILGTDSFMGIPIIFHYFPGEQNSKLEFGIGLEFQQMKNGGWFGGAGSNNSDVRFFCAFGYRYQPLNGGFQYRVVVYPFVGSSQPPVIILIGISLGYCF